MLPDSETQMSCTTYCFYFSIFRMYIMWTSRKGVGNSMWTSRKVDCEAWILHKTHSRNKNNRGKSCSKLEGFFFMPIENYLRNIHVALKKWKIGGKTSSFTITKSVIVKIWDCQGAENKFPNCFGCSLVPTAIQSTI